jgi:hypothetical protein
MVRKISGGCKNEKSPLPRELLPYCRTSGASKVDSVAGCGNWSLEIGNWFFSHWSFGANIRNNNQQFMFLGGRNKKTR